MSKFIESYFIPLKQTASYIQVQGLRVLKDCSEYWCDILTDKKQHSTMEKDKKMLLATWESLMHGISNTRHVISGKWTKNNDTWMKICQMI